MRLFFLPLLRDPDAQSCSQRLDQLEVDIDEMIQKQNPANNLPHILLEDPSGPSSISSPKDTIVGILVKQRILASLTIHIQDVGLCF
jgi:hypothetical protein